MFNDTPDGFVDQIAQTGRFGLGWIGYFGKESLKQSLDERQYPATDTRRSQRSIDRMRSYYWALLGDFSLKLEY